MQRETGIRAGRPRLNRASGSRRRSDVAALQAGAGHSHGLLSHRAARPRKGALVGRKSRAQSQDSSQEAGDATLRLTSPAVAARNGDGTAGRGGVPLRQAGDPGGGRAGQWDAVVAAVDSLDGAAQEMFVAYHVFGDTLFDIAERTRTTTYAVERALTLARQRLRWSLPAA